MDIFNSLHINNSTYIIYDIIAFSISVMIIISTLSIEKNETTNKIRRLYIVLELMLCLIYVMDAISWQTYFLNKYQKLFAFSSYACAFILCFIEMLKFIIYLSYLDVKNKEIIITTMIIYSICALLIVLPFTRNNIINIKENFIWNFGPWYRYWINVIVLINVYLILVVFKYYKKVGIINSIILIVLIIVEILQADILIKIEFTHGYFVIGFSALFFYLINYQKLLINYNLKSKEVMLQKMENEKILNQVFLSQIKPHFIFNTLSSIASLCTRNPKLAKEGINRFSLYLRNNSNSIGNETLISFSKELDNIDNYLYIEKMRYRERLNIKYEIEEEDFLVPTLCIQPLVENSVKHGIMEKEKGGTITIKTYSNNKYNVIEIKDDGVGFDTNIIDSLDNAHIGITNIKKRLYDLVNASVEFVSQKDKGTRVIVLIPKK